jgi:hypothetical protein
MTKDIKNKAVKSIGRAGADPVSLPSNAIQIINKIIGTARSM